MHDWFGGLPECSYFIGVVELQGYVYACSRNDPGQIGKSNVIVMEAQLAGRVEDHPLPVGAEWKDLGFVVVLIEASSTDRYLRLVLDDILGYVQSSRSALSSIPDPRYRLDWFRKANDFLTETVSSQGTVIHGRVTQNHMSITSTLLSVNSSMGLFFLKSPALSCHEVIVTAQVAGLFP